MIDQFLYVFIPLLIIVNPSSTLTLFIILTRGSPKKVQKKTALNATVFAAILLIIFAFTGTVVLDFLGVSIEALRIAGGVLLGFIGLDMLRRGEQLGEKKPDKNFSPIDYALVPLALPSLSGPGAITLTIVSMNHAEWWIVIIAIIVTMVIAYVVFRSAFMVAKILGRNGVNALTRIMGLLTVAIAIQFMLTGIGDWILTLSL